MFCSKCGNQVSDNARFCNACGAPLQAAPASAPAPKPAVEVDEFGVPVTPKAAPKPAVEVDEFGVPVAPKATPAPQAAASAPQVDEFGVPVYAQGGTAVAAKPVNKKLIIGIVAAIAAVALVIVLIVVLVGNGGKGGKDSKMSVIKSSLNAMCNDPGDIINLMPSKVISMVGEGLSRDEMKEDLRDEFEEWIGFKVGDCTIISENSSDEMLEQMNSAMGTSFDEYCVVYCSVVLTETDGFDSYSDDFDFVFHLLKDGGKWYLMFFEED